MISHFPQRVRFSVGALLLLVFAWLSAGAADVSVLSGTVLRVVDGDTVDVEMASGLIRVRLNAIDAPEKYQLWGKESTAYLTHRIAGKQIEVEPVSQDRYERLVAVVYLDGVNINTELVEHGHAWAFRKYMKKSDSSLCTVEDIARQAKLGLWGLTRAGTIAPWEFRKRKDRKGHTDFSDESLAKCIAAIGKR